MRKLMALLLLFSMAGCASIPPADMSKLHLGMTMTEVRIAVGSPLMTQTMYVRRQGKIYKTDVRVWEYRNILQGNGTLLFFYKGELKQIEQGYVKGVAWPAPNFEYEVK